MKEFPNHEDEVMPLKRAEGQIRGIQKMISEKKYCVDILNQLQAAIRALESSQERILERHMDHCVSNAMSGKDPREKEKKVKEVIKLVKQFRKG